MQVGVHAGLEYRNATQLVELRGVRFVVESAGDQHIEVGIARFPRRGNEIGPRDGAELRSDENGGALLGFAFEVTAFGADEIARPRCERRECDLVVFVRLLYAGRLEVL